jgi:hypothetical protein
LSDPGATPSKMVLAIRQWVRGPFWIKETHLRCRWSARTSFDGGLGQGRIGNNLNQLARVANTNQATPQLHELHLTTGMLKAALARVITL